MGKGRASKSGSNVNDIEQRELLEIAPSEYAAIRKHFENLRDDDSDLTMPVDGIVQIFKFLGVPLSSELVLSMASEHISPGQTRVTIDDVHMVFAEWKILTRLTLRDSQFVAVKNPRSRESKLKRLLLPDAAWRVGWSFVVMMVTLIHWTAVLERDADYGIYRDPMPLYLGMDFAFSAVYAIDLALWIFALRILAEHVHDGASVSYLHSVWLWTDVITALPLDAICSLAGAGLASGVLSHLRLLRLPRVIVFWIRSHEYSLSPTRIIFYFQVLPLWLLFYFVFAVVTVCALIFKLMSNEPSVHFLESVYFVIQTFTTVGYGDVAVNSLNQLWFAIFLVYFGLLMNAVAIGRLVTQIQRTNAYSTREDKLRQTLAVLQYFHLPIDLQTEILSYQEHVLWNDSANAYYSRTCNLPQAIRDTMLLQTRVDVLHHVPVFKDAPITVINSLAAALISICYKPEEYLSFSGDPHAGIRFVLFGFIARFDSRGHYETTVKSGDYFGFDGVLALADEAGSYKALSYCDVLLLPANDLRTILAKFPRYLQVFQQDLPSTMTDPCSDSAVEFTSEQLRELTGEVADRGQDLSALKSTLRALRRRLETLVAREGSGTNVTRPLSSAQSASNAPL